MSLFNRFLIYRKLVIRGKNLQYLFVWFLADHIEVYLKQKCLKLVAQKSSYTFLSYKLQSMLCKGFLIAQLFVPNNPISRPASTWKGLKLSADSS